MGDREMEVQMSVWVGAFGVLSAWFTSSCLMYFGLTWLIVLVSDLSCLPHRTQLYPSPFPKNEIATPEF